MDQSYTDQSLLRKMVGIYVREERMKRALDLDAVHRMTGLSVNQLRKLEQGKSRLCRETIRVLSSALGLDERRIEMIQDVARVAFVDELTELTWAQGVAGEA